PTRRAGRRTPRTAPRRRVRHPRRDFWPRESHLPCTSVKKSEGSAGSAEATSVIRVLGAERVLPPVVGRRVPIGVGDDAVDRAHGWQALLAPRAQLREDDHVDPVVEDGPELRRAVTKARVAVDADRHVDLERRILPLLVALTRLDALGAGTGGHEVSVDGVAGGPDRRRFVTGGVARPYAGGRSGPR